MKLIRCNIANPLLLELNDDTGTLVEVTRERHKLYVYGVFTTLTARQQKAARKAYRLAKRAVDMMGGV